jgi:CheY-like chemotaxis protein
MICMSILIIEDDLDIQGAIKESLEIEGYKNIYTANNGQEGIDLLNSIESPCVILLDVMMPVMDGWEFLKIAKEHNDNNKIATIPIVVVSAVPNAGKLAAASGAVGFVKKPINLDALLGTVRQFCN